MYVAPTVALELVRTSYERIVISHPCRKLSVKVSSVSGLEHCMI